MDFFFHVYSLGSYTCLSDCTFTLTLLNPYDHNENRYLLMPESSPLIKWDTEVGYYKEKLYASCGEVQESEGNQL